MLLDDLDLPNRRITIAGHAQRLGELTDRALHAWLDQRGAIARGDLQPGERPPAARTLAHSLGVNLHTVLRAYSSLHTEGLLDVRRGRGARVTDQAPTRSHLTGLAATLVVEARRAGLVDQEIRQLLEAQL